MSKPTTPSPARSPDPSGRANRSGETLSRGRILLAIVLVALVVRGIYWLEVRDHPLFTLPTGDAATYVGLAGQIHQEGWTAPRGEPFQLAPFYPYILAAVGKFGLGIPGVWALQFALGVAGAVLLFLLGARLGGPLVGAVAGLGGALYGPYLFFQGELLSISWAVFFLLLAMVIWGRPRWAMATGLLWGLASLAQPNILLAGALAAILSLLRPRILGWPGRRAAWLLLAGLAIFPALTFTRNLVVSGEPVLISTNGGVNLYIGNNPTADGSFSLPRESGLVNRPEGLFISAREVAEQSRGRSLSAVEVDRYWWLRALDFWSSEPGRALGLAGGKALLVLNNHEIPNHYDYQFFRKRIAILGFLPTFGWLLPLGGLGLILLVRRGRPRDALLFAALALSVIPFFVTARYRLPVTVFLWPAAGLAVRELWAMRRSTRSLVVLLGVGALYALLAFYPLITGTGEGHMYNVEGGAYAARGNLTAARRSFENAIRINPNHDEALNNLGHVHELDGDSDTAMQFYIRAISANPTMHEAYLNMERLYRAAGQPGDALKTLDGLETARGGLLGEHRGEVLHRRSINHAILGDSVLAIREAEEAVLANPSLAAGWIVLSGLLRAQHRSLEATAAARRATKLIPGDANAHFNLGWTLEQAGNVHDAARAYKEAVVLNPDHTEAFYRMGRILWQNGMVGRGEMALLSAQSGDLPHAGALWELGQLYEFMEEFGEARRVYDYLATLKVPQAEQARARLAALDALPVEDSPPDDPR